tara:strand:+ start:4031 stop:5410 length:1380 start_codon:yes stop_codon:yes gene_type:complete
MNDSILIIVDHKHRDMPGLSLIGYYLEKKYKYQIFYSATSMEDQLIEEKDPKYIIIPKLTYGIYSQLKWKLEGRKIIIVETEGNPQNDDQLYNITIYPDLYIFWNDHIKNQYYKKLLKSGTQMAVEGYYRSDFFCEPLKNIYNKEKIKLELGIKGNPQIITFATSTHDAHLSKKREIRNRKKTNRAYKKVPDYDMTIRSLKMQKKITEQFLFEIQKEFDDNTVFVIKPHPNESIIYWHNLIKENKFDNCYLMLGKNINELLTISDFHISHGVCSTTAEAMLYGLNTLELVTNLSDKIYTKNHLDLPDYRCYSASEMISVLKKVLFENKKTSQKNIFKKYAKKYYKKVDGKVCYRYAKKINEFVINSNDSTNVKLSHLIKYFALFHAMKLRNIIFFNRTNKENQFVKEVYNLDEKKSNNTNHLIINGKSVHKDFGVYDNKIKPDDYKFWYKKFYKIGILL